MPSDIDRLVSELAAHTVDDQKRITNLALLKTPDAAVEQALEPPITTLAEYLATPIPVPPTVIGPGIVVRGGVHAMIGRAGKGKTEVGLNRILRWAAGRPFFDELPDVLNPIDGVVRSLIIENEGAAGMFHHRIGVMMANAPFSAEEKAEVGENVLIWGEGGYSGLRLDDRSAYDQISRGIDKHKPDIVFLEPFRSLWQGEENSASEMDVVLDACVELGSEHGVAVLISHHAKKNNGEDTDLMNEARGSTALEGRVETMEHFKPISGGKYRTLEWSKLRHCSVPPQAMTLDYNGETRWYSLVPLEDSQSELLDVLKDGHAHTTHQLLEATTIPEKRLRDSLNELVAADKVVREQTDTGRGGRGYAYRIAGNDDGLEIT